VHEGLFDIFGEKGKNIITHHAEDGSGVGSAIIAGAYIWLVAQHWILTSVLGISHDEDPQGCWAVCECLNTADAVATKDNSTCKNTQISGVCFPFWIFVAFIDFLTFRIAFAHQLRFVMLSGLTVEL
jgi:hypothetical protein